MSNSVFQVNISSIENNRNEMMTTFNEFLEMCKKYREMIEDTACICDTSTAKIYREFVEKYLDYRLGNIEKSFRSKIDMLTDIAKIYKEEDCSIERIIKGE